MDWFKEKLISRASQIYVIELNGKPVGQVRYDRTGKKEAEIDFFIAPEYRGHGLGTLALNLTIDMARRDLKVDRVKGVVIAENGASCAAFRKAGFLEQDAAIVQGHPCRIFNYPAEELPTLTHVVGTSDSPDPDR